MVRTKKRMLKEDFITLCCNEGLTKLLAIRLWNIANYKTRRLLTDTPGTKKWVQDIACKFAKDFKGADE